MPMSRSRHDKRQRLLVHVRGLRALFKTRKTYDVSGSSRRRSTASRSSSATTSLAASVRGLTSPGARRFSHRQIDLGNALIHVSGHGHGSDADAKFASMMFVTLNS